MIKQMAVILQRKENQLLLIESSCGAEHHTETMQANNQTVDLVP